MLGGKTDNKHSDIEVMQLFCLIGTLQKIKRVIGESVRETCEGGDYF